MQGFKSDESLGTFLKHGNPASQRGSQHIEKTCEQMLLFFIKNDISNVSFKKAL
jgi:hypothetical protein